MTWAKFLMVSSSRNCAQPLKSVLVPIEKYKHNEIWCFQATYSQCRSGVIWDIVSLCMHRLTSLWPAVAGHCSVGISMTSSVGSDHHGLEHCFTSICSLFFSFPKVVHNGGTAPMQQVDFWDTSLERAHHPFSLLCWPNQVTKTA